jgi:hypothetical protein
MQETPAQDRELTLLRIHKPGMERAAQQLMEMRKDPIAWQEYIDEIDAVTAGPIEDDWTN